MHGKGVLSRRKRERFLVEFSRLQDVTGPARDYEVWMSELSDDDTLKAVLAGYYDSARREAVSALDSRRVKRLLARWHSTLADLPSGKTSVSSDERIADQHALVMKAAETASIDAPAPALHRLRKRAKELRYVIELFAREDAPEARNAMRKELKKIQDELGHVQDAAVQREWLIGHAAEVGPLDVRLKELDERDAAARAAYGERFAAFAAIDSGRNSSDMAHPEARSD
jgi:CHAD domain-containing protein